jgi:AraC family transcriptional regulator, transcriptional activator of pobA
MSKKDKVLNATLLNPEQLKHYVLEPSFWEQMFLSPFHNLFQINTLEFIRQHIKLPLPPYRTNVHNFVWIRSGSAVWYKGLDGYPVKANTLFFLPAYQLHVNTIMSEDITGYYCHFDPNIFNTKFIQNELWSEFSFWQYTGHPVVELPETALPIVLNIFERLNHIYKVGNKDHLEIVSGYLLTLFLELKQFAQPPEKQVHNTAAQLTQKYKEALTRHVYEYPNVLDFAKLLNVSHNYLNRCIHATTGKSAHDLLKEVLILEAKALLKQSTLSISEVAYRIGKKDHSDFSRFFKANTGLTPKSYRAEI